MVKCNQRFYFQSIEEGKQIQNYVRVKDFKSASKKLFDKPFPRESNDFKVDQRLEAIDPEHEALFCVMTVSEVCGNVYCYFFSDNNL